jgi:hypothetical protein
MKKIFTIFLLILSGTSLLRSQCVQTCSNYAVLPITYSLETTAGNILNLDDDELSNPISIGFTFTFMCSPKSQLLVSSNGFLTFDLSSTNSGCCSGGMVPDAFSAVMDMIAFTWNDLDPSGLGSITYTTLGSSPNQVFVLTYSDVPHCCGPGPVNSGQIKLFESDNSIEIHSAVITNDGSPSTQGIMDATGTIGFTTPGANSQNYTTTTTAYRFTNDVPTQPDAVSGPSSVCSGVFKTFSVSPNPSALAYNWSFPGGWTGTSSTNTISAAPGSAGNISVSATYTCGTSSATELSVSVIPSPTVSLTGNNSPICQGVEIVLSAAGADTYTWNTGATSSTIAITPANTTSYMVTGTSSITNCPGKAITTVSVHPALNLMTAGSGSICEGGSANLAANGGVSYTWQPGNLNGFYVTVSPTVSTLYTVSASSAEGCIEVAYVNLEVQSCIGLEDHLGPNFKLQLQPNPNSGEFAILLENAAQKFIEIYDYTGKKVFETNSFEDHIDIKMNEFVSGIYSVKVMSQDKVSVLRMIKL